MSIPTVTITGNVLPPDNIAAGGTISFELSTAAVDLGSGVVVPRKVAVQIGAGGAISAAIWPNGAGENPSFYSVWLEMMPGLDGDCVRRVKLGNIAIAASPSSQDLADLIAAGASASGGAALLEFQFANRAALVSKVASGLRPIPGFTYWADGLAYLGQTGATDIPDLPGLVPNAVREPGHFGSLATPASATATIAAAADPAEYLAISGAVETDGNLAGEGVFFGKTVDARLTREAAGGSSNQYLFSSVQDGFTIRDMAVELREDTVPGAVFVASQSADDMVISGASISGNVEVVGGVRNYAGSVFLVGPGGRDGLLIENSKFSDLAYLFLKSNATVSDESDIRIVNSVFRDFANIPLLFNSPAVGSSITGIYIAGNDVGSNHDASGASHRGSFAGNVRSGRVIGNYFHGDGNEMFRMEEGADSHVFSANIADLNGEHGFETIANNVSGVSKTPERTVFSDNVVNGLAGATGAGFHDGITVNGSGIKDSIIRGNIFSGWEWGIRTSGLAHTNIVSDNLLIDNDFSLRVHRPTQNIRENISLGCPTPIRAQGLGGMMGRLHIRAETGLPPEITSMVTLEASGTPVALTGWTWEAHNFTTTAGSMNIPLMPIGYMFAGRISLMWARSTIHQSVIADVSWDGTTLTKTPVVARGTGGVVFSGSGTNYIYDNSGVLTVGLFNALSDQSNSILHINFDGVHLWT